MLPFVIPVDLGKRGPLIKVLAGRLLPGADSGGLTHAPDAAEPCLFQDRAEAHALSFRGAAAAGTFKAADPGAPAAVRWIRRSSLPG